MRSSWAFITINECTHVGLPRRGGYVYAGSEIISQTSDGRHAASVNNPAASLANGVLLSRAEIRAGQAAHCTVGLQNRSRHGAGIFGSGYVGIVVQNTGCTAIIDGCRSTQLRSPVHWKAARRTIPMPAADVVSAPRRYAVRQFIRWRGIGGPKQGRSPRNGGDHRRAVV